MWDGERVDEIASEIERNRCCRRGRTKNSDGIVLNEVEGRDSKRFDDSSYTMRS